MVVFNSDLNKFSRTYLIKNPGENEKELERNFASSYQRSLANVIEQLLLFDKISLKVYGENMPLVVLVNELGVNQVMELIEENVIEFVLWTPILTTMVNDDLIGKAMPIQSGNATSTVHCDPKESAIQGINRIRISMPRSTRRDLQRKIAKRYKIPRPEFVHKAADIVMSAYSSNNLEALGLKKEKDIKFLDATERSKLLSLGDDILETTILADFKYASVDNDSYYAISKASFDSISRVKTITDSFEQILRVERLPNIYELIVRGQLQLEELVKIRRKKASIEFRKWLQGAATDSEYISKQYISEIANHKGILETNFGKFLKTIGMFSVSAVVGAALGGVEGSILGFGAGKVLEPAVDLGLDFFDAYLLDGLLKGWHPKMFVSEFEKLINMSSNE